MKKLIVTRHAGLIEYLRRNNITGDVTPHLNLDEVSSNITQVWGVIPLPLIAKLNEKGIDVYNVNLNMPLELRGKELTLEQMDQVDVAVNKVTVTLTPVNIGD